MPTLQFICVSLALALASFAQADLFDAPPIGPGQTQAEFAGGAVKLVYDHTQHSASELPRGLQVLLVLSRHDPPESPAELTDGLWIGRRQSPTAASTAADDLLAMVQRELQRDLRRARLTAYEQADLLGNRGVRQGFKLPSQKRLFAAPGEASSAADGAVQGWRQLLRTDAGLIEIHFAAPANQFAERQQELATLLATLQFAAPQSSQIEVAPELLAAEPIVGRWKSPRALLELTGEGEIKLTYDRKKSYRLDKQGLVDYEKPVQRLSGKYEAQDDLIRIRWADGSLLNIRWRTAGDELLITDHHGRTRRLARLHR